MRFFLPVRIKFKYIGKKHLSCLRATRIAFSSYRAEGVTQNNKREKVSLLLEARTTIRCLHENVDF
jgi:hypothetical protein